MKQFKKKVARITGILILSLGLFMSPLFTSKVDAYVDMQSGHGTFVQGSYNWVYYSGGIFDITGACGVRVHIECSHVYSGIMTITINGLGNFADAGYWVVGGQINTTSLNQIQLQLTYDQVIDVTFVSSAAYNPNNTPTVSVGMTNATNYGDELATLRTISTTISTLSSTATTINNNILGLINDVQDINTAICEGLFVDPDSNGFQYPYLWMIYDELANNVSQTLNGIDISFGLLLQDISTIDSRLSTISTNISSILSAVNSMKTTLTGISTSVQTAMHTNLDIPRWQLLAYRWAVSVGYVSGQYSTWSSTTSTGWLNRYTNPDGDHQFTPAKGHYLQAATSSQPNGRKYIIAWASTSANTSATYTIHWSNSSSSGWNVDSYFGSNSNGGYRDGVYFNYVIVYNNYTPQSVDRGFEIEFNNRIYISPIYVGYLDVMPDEAYALLGFQKTDELLAAATSYFSDSLDLLQEIADGISGLSGSQTDIDNSITITNDFDTSMTTVNNVEVGILTDIDVKFQNVIDSITTNEMNNAPNYVSNPRNLFSFYFNHLGSHVFGLKQYVYLIVILFVVLVLMG